MDTNTEKEDEAITAKIRALIEENVKLSSSRKSSLKESDGLPSPDERRDSDTISEAEEEFIRKMLSERRMSFRPQPKETVPYEVQATDTLQGIAARYNVTPSELAKLNRLNSHLVCPGQIIYIPEKNSLRVLEEILQKSAAASASSIASDEGSPKPGHAERVPGMASEDVFLQNLPKHSMVDSLSSKDGVETKESIRINSKYVTDGQGVVNGVLIVTTNHIMFDPNVSDPLVIEYGMEKYGVEAPMDCIVKAALYSDIFRMRKDASGKTINVYHSKAPSMKKSKSHGDKLVKEDKFKNKRRSSAADSSSKIGMSISNSFQESLSKICEQADGDEEADEENNSSLANNEVAPAAEDNPQQDAQPPVKKPLSSSSSVDSDEGCPSSRKASMSDDDGGPSLTEFGSLKKKSGFEKTKNKLTKGLRKLSITSDNIFPPASTKRRMSLPLFGSLPDFMAKSSSKSSDSHKASEEEIQSGPTYVNMVEEKPELFAPIDKLIPRPATSFCDTPLYLCLRMGDPINHPTSISTPVLHFGQKMKPEYWFSIPKDNVDSLYHFFLRWCPEKYGDIDNINYEELGFIPIECEEKEESENNAPVDQRRSSWALPWKKPKDVAETSHPPPSSSPDDWELLDYIGNLSTTIIVPELLTPSTILNDEQILKIAKHLPARAMNSWSLIYSTTAHGFSLKTMYRKMLDFDCPVLIVVSNRGGEIFGALLSSPLRMSDHFYGTGESFLFTFSPEFKVFHWSGENSYFIKGNVDSFMIGSSEGQFGLWLDDDLFRGRTSSCQTFNNDPLCAEKDFVVKSLEAWGFI